MSTARCASINSLMRRKMRRWESREKSSGVELFGGLGVGGIVEQDGAEDGFFGVDVRGQAGVEGEIGDGGHVSSLS